MYSNKPFAEFEYTIGPIKMSREFGKEVISRFDTSFKTNGVFYTDANGREMQMRKRDTVLPGRIKVRSVCIIREFEEDNEIRIRRRN